MRHSDGLHPGRHAKPGLGVFDVGVHRMPGNAEDRADFWVALAARRPMQALELTLAQLDGGGTVNRTTGGAANDWVAEA